MFTSPLMPKDCTLVLETTIALASDDMTAPADAEAVKYAANLRSKFSFRPRSATVAHLRQSVIFVPHKLKIMLTTRGSGHVRTNNRISKLTVLSRSSSRTG